MCRRAGGCCCELGGGGRCSVDRGEQGTSDPASPRPGSGVSLRVSRENWDGHVRWGRRWSAGCHQSRRRAVPRGVDTAARWPGRSVPALTIGGSRRADLIGRRPVRRVRWPTRRRCNVQRLRRPRHVGRRLLGWPARRIGPSVRRAAPPRHPDQRPVAPVAAARALTAPPVGAGRTDVGGRSGLSRWFPSGDGSTGLRRLRSEPRGRCRRGLR